MNDSAAKRVHAKWPDRLPPLRWSFAWLLLSAATLLAFFPVTAVAYWLHGPGAIWAAAVAAGTCWLGSSLALALTAQFGRAGVNAPLYTLLFGLLGNCMLPFTLGLILSRASGPLAEAGVFGLTMVFFLFALAVETLLSLCVIKSPR